MEKIPLQTPLIAAAAAANQSPSSPGVTRLAESCSLLILAGTLFRDSALVQDLMLVPCPRCRNWGTWDVRFKSGFHYRLSYLSYQRALGSPVVFPSTELVNLCTICCFLIFLKWGNECVLPNTAEYIEWWLLLLACAVREGLLASKSLDPSPPQRCVIPATFASQSQGYACEVEIASK